MKKINFLKQEWLLLLTGIYCVISVMMNFLCMKPLSFWTSFVWMDGGLVISWIVFMVSNIIIEVYGKRTAILITTIAAVVTLFISVIAVIEVHLPTLPDYTDQAKHFEYIFSNGPRTIVSSVIAFMIGNIVNIEIIDFMKKRQKNKDNRLRFMYRSVVSTIFGQLVDNGLFQTLAFAPIGLSIFEMEWYDIGTAILAGSAFETIVEAMFVPFITIPLTKYLQNKND